MVLEHTLLPFFYRLKEGKALSVHFIFIRINNCVYSRVFCNNIDLYCVYSLPIK